MVRGKAAETSPPPKTEETGPPPPEANGGAAGETEDSPPDHGRPQDDNVVKANDLNPEQQFALTAQWANQVANQKAVVDEAKTEYDSQRQSLRNLYKQVKAEIGTVGVARVKRMVELRTDENAETTLRAELDELVWLVQWTNAIPGMQLDLLSDLSDLRPIVDRAHHDGKLDGLAGKPFGPKYGQGSEAYHAYQRGWEEGQDVLRKGFKPMEKPPEAIGDPSAQTTA